MQLNKIYFFLTGTNSACLACSREPIRYQSAGDDRFTLNVTRTDGGDRFTQKNVSGRKYGPQPIATSAHALPTRDGLHRYRDQSSGCVVTYCLCVLFRTSSTRGRDFPQPLRRRHAPAADPQRSCIGSRLIFCGRANGDRPGTDHTTLYTHGYRGMCELTHVLVK